MKISILLPFKENFTKSFAGAVSLFVKDTVAVSKFNKKIKIFGSTDHKDYLNKNYVNLNIEKSIFSSSNTKYVNKFLKHKKFLNTDILEVHNRPNYIKIIRNNYKKKLILYFHNDPLTMTGSKKLSERKYIYNNTDILMFNSLWSKKRFFINFNNNDINENKVKICYQSTNKVPIRFSKKEKIISFIGKLNSAKGYDIFGKAIIKILNDYKDWKAYVIGDEPREKIQFVHQNLINLGFKNNNFILNFLKKVSISVVPSRWDEPFGRASLEASSRGSAVIISNKGGLPETTKSAIILKELDENSLYKEIKELIENKKKLLIKQKQNHKNFFLDHKYVVDIIDKARLNFFTKNINFHNKKILKILHVTNFNYRFDGRLQYNTGRRINNGLIRLGHNVLTLSDRDVLKQNKNFLDPFGKNTLKNKIINCYNNFKPDLIIFGHADSIDLDTIKILKNKGVKICEWFLDPVSKYGPDYTNNKKRILEKNELIDACFLTSDPTNLDFKINNSFYIPNPSDPSFETLENYKHDCKNDLFFAMSHGVHRGQLKKGKKDDREIFLNRLLKITQDITFDIYGLNNVQPIWGTNFLKQISNSSMGLNLSRGKPYKYYSSDRIAQLMGNGLLTFVDKKTRLNDFFSNKELIFYNDIYDLSYKLKKYKKDVKQRKKIAKNGKKFYLKHFNSNKVAQFIIDKTFNFKSKERFIWVKK